MEDEDQVEVKDSNDVLPPLSPTSPTTRLVIGKLDENNMQRQTLGSTTATNTITDLREAERVLSTNIYFSDLSRCLEFSLAFACLSDIHPSIHQSP